MEIVAQRPKALTKKETTYCAGCPHGIAHRIIAEVMDELKITSKTIGVCPVGCSVFAYDFFNCDFISAAHGRAPAVATGIKKARPETVVFTYQGDGDLAAIGTAEIIHAANRGENFTVFFVNNAIYGMTGGQMAPTTLKGMKTSTSPYGRDIGTMGHPIHVCEMLNTLESPFFIQRCSLLSPLEVNKAKKAVKKAMLYNLEGRGFSFVELISTCSTNWGMTPVNAMKWAKENMLPIFKIGNFRDKG